jgi:hypothetical protein
MVADTGSGKIIVSPRRSAATMVAAMTSGGQRPSSSPGRAMSVAIGPGKTAATLVPHLASSARTHCVIDHVAALVAQ